jgi:hypothetical protein
MALDWYRVAFVKIGSFSMSNNRTASYTFPAFCMVSTDARLSTSDGSMISELVGVVCICFSNSAQNAVVLKIAARINNFFIMNKLFLCKNYVRIRVFFKY